MLPTYVGNLLGNGSLVSVRVEKRTCPTCRVGGANFHEERFGPDCSTPLAHLLREDRAMQPAPVSSSTCN
jgi:hypothetical protein